MTNLKKNKITFLLIIRWLNYSVTEFRWLFCGKSATEHFGGKFSVAEALFSTSVLAYCTAAKLVSLDFFATIDL